ncbi:redox-sensing transcriptional repressor Rex [Carboxydocella sp. JDF658]|uniref:redox-sensing transcriptional repressor Rex n=1 Tax=Carboxydocella sp. JDF658 TaxID=1926600 RepID=UPI0009AE9402|nr:redox-sensing transcriptional repressor Rex [Carboxydocella sp. JDF658]GAW30865.1 redox-sensing transcriptional repressor Rex [Carboxydocella sp. JDF658]
MKNKEIPELVVRRLNLYARCLGYLEEMGVLTVSSKELGDRLGIADTLVRKDLSYLGEFGHRGVGYYVSQLRHSIRKMMGADKPRALVIVGAGNLGLGIGKYHQHFLDNHRVVAYFDTDPEKIGQSVEGIPIYPMEKMEEIVAGMGVELAVLAVPKDQAQRAAEKLVLAGVRGILNFAPIALQLPPTVRVAYADLTLELQNLAYFLEKEANSTSPAGFVISRRRKEE